MRVGIAVFVCVLASCGAPADSQTKTTPVTAPTKADHEVPAVATIGGRLRAHDGGPLKAAEFAVLRPGFLKAHATGSLAADGSFRVEVEPGVYMLSVAAVDHAQVVQSVVVERAIEVEGSLGTHARAEPGETLPLRSELLAADGEVIASGPTTATRTAAGKYRVALTDLPPKAVKLRYQLVGEDGRTYNGPLADSHDSDGWGSFWSVVTLAGREAIELDLAGLPPAGKAPQLTWRGEAPELVALRAYRERWEPRVARVRANTPRTDGKLGAPGEEDRAELAALASEAMAEAEAARSDDERMLLRLAHLDLFAEFDDEAAARARAEWVVEHVDPGERRLGLYLFPIVVVSRVGLSADEALKARIAAWIERMQANPNAELALDALSILIHEADGRGDGARVAELYARVREPRFAGAAMAQHLMDTYDPDRPLQRGKRFPDFEFPALAAGEGPVRQADRVGKLYLIEFWATWCGPCVAQMEHLHAAYAKINGARAGEDERGLRRLAPVEAPKIEFVFVSFDASPEAVQSFRAEHWSMPWTHAFVGQAGQAKVMKQYGFSGVPAAILVDGAGTIVAVNSDLKGELLLPALERALASR